MISIIVPVYKVEEYLNRCIQSILNQTYKKFELILVDDGSPDHCPELCDEWAKRDKRIKVIHKENGGLSDARNAGIEIAVGEFVAFVDSDDWISVSYLELLMRAMQENDCEIVECETVRTTGKNTMTDIVVTDIGKAVVFQPEEALELLIQDDCFHQYVWNKLYKRSVIQDILFEKGKTNEDEFWTYQIFGNAKRICKIDVPLYFYFQRSTSIMGTRYSLKRLDALEAKMQRQKYIEEIYPGLKEVALVNLFTSCIYQGQMSLSKLKGEQFYKAREQIDSIVNQIKITKGIMDNMSLSTRIWTFMAKISFWGTCRVKNLLKKGL